MSLVLILVYLLAAGCLTYPNSPDYRPDVDTLPPAQGVVLETVKSIDMKASGVPSLIMRDLAEYVTLPFLGSFDIVAPPDTPTTSHPVIRSTSKKVTYIAFGKRAMPYLVELFLSFKDRSEIYVDGTLEQIVAVRTFLVEM